MSISTVLRQLTEEIEIQELKRIQKLLIQNATYLIYLKNQLLQ